MGSTLFSSQHNLKENRIDPIFLLSNYNYSLPKDLIAQYPAEKREDARLLVLNRATSAIEHRKFPDLIEYMSDGDVLVLNNTKVIPARIRAHRKDTGGKAEVLILENLGKGCYRALIDARRRMKLKERIINEKVEIEVCEDLGESFIVRFLEDLPLGEVGVMPLPPYIKRPAQELDLTRYQTVYAKAEGAIAAPTAGLHFTQGLLDALVKKGVHSTCITLHIGLGTFKPVESEDISQHRMEREYFEASGDAIEAIRTARRVVAVGSTSARAIETLASEGIRESSLRGRSEAEAARRSRGGTDEASGFAARRAISSGWTDLFIHPPYEFKAVDALITNFHLPRTTLLMLVSAFAGREKILQAYEEAIAQRYRFYSYGDAMLIL